MQVANLCTHTQNSLHVFPSTFLNLLPLLGCWYYKNNHYSLVVVNNECFCCLSFFLLPIRLFALNGVSLCLIIKQEQLLLLKHGGLTTFSSYSTFTTYSTRTVRLHSNVHWNVESIFKTQQCQTVESVNITTANSNIITQDKHCWEQKLVCKGKVSTLSRKNVTAAFHLSLLLPCDFFLVLN